MTDRAAFVEAIQADPDGDGPRLAFADWLDDHGEPARAELIRVQCEDARRPSDALKRRAGELLGVLGETWPSELLGDWRPNDVHPEERVPFDQYRSHFVRGFLTHLMPDAAEFLACVEKYRRWGEPVFDLTLWHWPRPEHPPQQEWLPALVASPHLRVVRCVGGRVPAATFASPHLSRLSVVVSHARPGNLHQLAASPSPFTLRKLTLLDEEDAPADVAELVAALAESPRFADLESLRLEVHGVRWPHLRTLIGSPHLPPTLALTVSHGPRLHRRSAEARLLRSRFPGPAGAA